MIIDGMHYKIHYKIDLFIINKKIFNKSDSRQ